MTSLCEGNKALSGLVMTHFTDIHHLAPMCSSYNIDTCFHWYVPRRRSGGGNINGNINMCLSWYMQTIPNKHDMKLDALPALVIFARLMKLPIILYSSKKVTWNTRGRYIYPTSCLYEKREEGKPFQQIITVNMLITQNYIVLLITPGFNKLSKDNCKKRREPFNFLDLVGNLL